MLESNGNEQPIGDDQLQEEHSELQKKYKHLKMKYKEKQEDLSAMDELNDHIDTLKKARDGYRNTTLD